MFTLGSLISFSPLGDRRLDFLRFLLSFRRIQNNVDLLKSLYLTSFALIEVLCCCSGKFYARIECVLFL